MHISRLNLPGRCTECSITDATRIFKGRRCGRPLRVGSNFFPARIWDCVIPPKGMRACTRALRSPRRCAGLPEIELERERESLIFTTLISQDARFRGNRTDVRPAAGRLRRMRRRMTNLFSFRFPPCERVTRPQPVFATRARYDQFRASYFVTIAQRKISPPSRIHQTRVKIAR